MFNFIKDFTLKIIEKFNFTFNNNSTTIIYNFPNNTNINTKNYSSISKRNRILILLFINIIYILVFCSSFYLIKNPFIKASFLKIFPEPFPEIHVNFFHLIGYILLFISLISFNKKILTRNFYKSNLIKFIIKYLISIFILLSIFSNIFVVIIYRILKFLFITASLLNKSIEYLLP
ncbi:hypothetical protein CJD_1843 [Clostridium perfringens D str. JGS1721]|uniref:Uncharacterized protein n=1 Tax=Clostridium perfringens D str. JGS1721 TaxID=488537 RepID=B1V1E6_CLOPF|nr:hypothetical protein CJD_1843 [Clostridium perfringens D str. JGS1721]